MKKLIIVVSLVALAACSQPETVTVYQTVVPEIKLVDRPRPVSIQKVDAVLLTREEMTKRLEDPEFREMVGITKDDYQKLLNNLVDTARYIEMQRKVIKYYETTITELSEK